VASVIVFFVCFLFSPPLSNVFTSAAFSLCFLFSPLVDVSIAAVKTLKVHFIFEHWHRLHVGVRALSASLHPSLLPLCLHRLQGGLNPMMPVLERAVTCRG